MVNVWCVLKSVYVNVLGMAVRNVEILIYVYPPALGFTTLGLDYKYFYMGGCMLPHVLVFLQVQHYSIVNCCVYVCVIQRAVCKSVFPT